MPFLVPAITAIGSALSGVVSWLGGSTILSGLARIGVGLAAKYALGSLLGGQTSQSQAAQLDTTYGEDIVRTVAMGRCATAGQHIYRNAFGSGNRHVQDARILSHFRCTGITRVRYNGEWRTLDAAVDPTYGHRITDAEVDIYVNFHVGSMGQAADAGLIAKANPPSRWTSAHRAAGLSYAAVMTRLDRDKQQTPWEAFFEFEGAPLYDFRKDSSIGGSGSHRWNDQDTWEFSENPVLMMYALERGFFNGTEMMVGKGTPASRLPLAEWTLAANICDETVGDGPRYTAALIAAAGAGVTHDANLQPLLEACAATWVEDATGEYPIAGAAQSTVMTFTDDDIMVDEAFRFSTKRTKSELTNTLAGTYLEPDSFYAQTPFAVRINAAALAEDGERLAVSIPYSAVNRAEVADRLADIAFKASRYQGNGEICIHPKFLANAQVGRWVEWDSAEYGARKFQLVDKHLGPFSDKATRNIYVTLQEVDDDIFEPSEYVTVPTVPALPGVPDYATSASNFTALGVQLQVTGSEERKAAIRFSWDAFDDVTVVAVDVEYRPVGDAVTISIANPAVITWPSHNLQADDPFYLATTGALPTGLLPGQVYYAKTILSPNTFSVAAAPGGAAVVTTGTQSGVHSAYRNSIVARAAVPLQVLVVADGVLSDTEYEYRHRIIPDPPRATFFTGWSTVVTPASSTVDISVGLNDLQQDVIDVFLNAALALQDAREKLDRIAAMMLDQAGQQIKDTSVAVRFRNATAAAMQTLSASVTEIDGELVAIAEAVTAVEASVGLVSADGLFQIRAEAGTGDVVARMVAEVRATIGSDWVSAGWIMDAGFVGGDPGQPFSRFLVKAEQFVVTDGTEEGTPLVYEDGVLKLQVARIGTAIIDLFKTSSEKVQLGSFGGGAEGLRIFV